MSLCNLLMNDFGVNPVADVINGIIMTSCFQILLISISKGVHSSIFFVIIFLDINRTWYCSINQTCGFICFICECNIFLATIISWGWDIPVCVVGCVFHCMLWYECVKSFITFLILYLLSWVELCISITQFCLGSSK